MEARIQNQITEFRAIRDELYDSVFEAVQIMNMAHAHRNTINPVRLEEVHDWYDEKEMFIYNQLKHANKNLDTILDMCMDGKSDSKIDEWKTMRDEAVEMNLKYMDSVRELLHGATDSKTVDVYKVAVRLNRRGEMMLDAKLDECLS
jgi:hypothetical protein